jgi:hypothetical protein
VSSATARPSSLSSLRKNSHSFSRSPSTAKLFTPCKGKGIRAATSFVDVFFSGLHPSANVAPLSCSGGNSRPPGHSLRWSASFPRTALIVLGSLPRNLRPNAGKPYPIWNQSPFATLCPRTLRSGSSSHSQNETTFRRETARIIKSRPVTGFTTTAMTRSPLARNSETISVGFQPKSLAPSQSRSSTRSPQ